MQDCFQLCVHYPKSILLPSPFIRLSPLFYFPYHHPFPSDNHHTVVCAYEVWFLFSQSLHFFHPAP